MKKIRKAILEFEASKKLDKPLYVMRIKYIATRSEGFVPFFDKELAEEQTKRYKNFSWIKDTKLEETTLGKFIAEQKAKANVSK